eukprot:CAMPEP_0185203628 /NCGR_PEP_ID=MMETSP1140-20130426/53378_1 /TAXON_ID=298111 /ORGANISM="Pavlova sp., Strain CCMP459" /LENGTH=60 /DNA_ID=CAMNT_0027771139 /DNA_START=364 /DNA_END=543 /DNA_ORIENTATION=+
MRRQTIDAVLGARGGSLRRGSTRSWTQQARPAACSTGAPSPLVAGVAGAGAPRLAGGASA